RDGLADHPWCEMLGLELMLVNAAARCGNCRSRLRNGLARRQRLAGIGHAIVFVLDGQSGTSTQPDIADRLVPDRKPEALEFLVFVTNFVLFRPERRLLRGLGFDTRNCEVGSVHPHFTAIDILAPGFWAYPKQ